MDYSVYADTQRKTSSATTYRAGRDSGVDDVVKRAHTLVQRI